MPDDVLLAADHPALRASNDLDDARTAVEAAEKKLMADYAPLKRKGD